MARTTRISSSAWVIAWDARHGRHRYIRDADVVFEGDTLTHVGPGYAGDADEVVPGDDLLVMPGLVNVHSHPANEPAYRGVREDHGNPAHYMSGLYERSIAFRLDPDGRLAAAETTYCDLLLSGVTTLADLSFPYPGWIELIGRSGLRGYVAPGYASARWHMDNGLELKFRWDEDAGRRGLDTALALIDDAERHPSGRLRGVVYPAQIDTCTEALFRDSIEAARERRRVLTTHIAQSVCEVLEMIRRHGRTPIQWASEIGLLRPNTLLGHAIFLDDHPWHHWHSRDDLRLLAESGAGVAHCPTPFARYGQTLRDLGRYRRAGIPVGIGTDCIPHNMIEEMRWAVVLARVSAENLFTVVTEDVLEAATVAGARALGRDDIGRLAPGCKADLVLVDLRQPEMRPVRDPLRSLLFSAADRAVRDVYVDGRKVVAERKVLTLDREDAYDRLEASQRRMLERTPEHDYAGRPAEQVAPLSLMLE